MTHNSFLLEAVLPLMYLHHSRKPGAVREGVLADNARILEFARKYAVDYVLIDNEYDILLSFFAFFQEAQAENPKAAPIRT